MAHVATVSEDFRSIHNGPDANSYYLAVQVDVFDTVTGFSAGRIIDVLVNVGDNATQIENSKRDAAIQVGTEFGLTVSTSNVLQNATRRG